nr:hypothetical protein Itr_chr06CG15740 [Ipomoea trifida]
MKPLAHSKHSSRKPLPTITKVTSEVMESYGSRSQDDDRRRDSRFPILFYSAASFTGQSNGFLSSPPPPASTSDVGRQTTQPDDVNEDSSDDGELRPACIEQQQWGLRRQQW